MLKNFSRRILHILYPTRCPVCGDFIGWNDSFCENCESLFVTFEDDYCISGTDGFCAVFVYNENISPAIMLLKDGVCGNADFALGNALAAKIKILDFAKDVDMIIPVPIHKKTFRQRGYNQSELIARQAGYNLNIKVCSNIIVKNRLTAQQKELSRKERLINLKDSFSVVKPELITGKSILLIDDVCTTGSTFMELANTLQPFKPRKILCAACCKTELEKP